MTQSFSCLRMLVLAFVLGLAFMIAPAAQAKANPKYASIVMDADTGAILHESNANKKLHPASLTKVMTLLMVFEALERGEMSLNDRIFISKHAAGQAPSKLGLPVGSSIKVRDAIYALVTKSANDIAAAVAEHMGRSERNFASMMTERAREIGMSQTTFVNASGLHNPGQISTARDMARLARFVIKAYPEYYSYFSTKNFTYNGQTYGNHNKLMGRYNGMDGMKTGYIGPSGFNLVASAVRGNHRLIGVVFGGRTGRSRDDHMAELLDLGFSKVDDVRIASANIPVPSRKPAIANAVAALTASPAMASIIPTDIQPAAGNLQVGIENLLGQGDLDPADSRRMETGLMAIAAHTAEHNQHTPPVTNVAYHPATASPWSVQVGAFNSRAATDRALHDAMKSLPKSFDNAKPMIAPMKTSKGWLFRARLTGLSKNEAVKACKYLRDCLPVAPQN